MHIGRWVLCCLCIYQRVLFISVFITYIYIYILFAFDRFQADAERLAAQKSAEAKAAALAAAGAAKVGEKSGIAQQLGVYCMPIPLSTVLIIKSHVALCVCLGPWADQ